MCDLGAGIVTLPGTEERVQEQVSMTMRAQKPWWAGRAESLRASLASVRVPMCRELCPYGKAVGASLNLDLTLSTGLYILPGVTSVCALRHPYLWRALATEF